MKLWDVENRELIGTLEGHEVEVTVAFSPDGRTLASGSGRLRLWEVATLGATFTSPPDRVTSVSFSPDGHTLVSGSRGQVRLWDLMTQEVTATLQGHTALVHSLAFTRYGRTLASGAADGTTLLWKLKPQPPPQSLTKAPGRDQQGAAGTVLGEPFVVLVLDPNGDPLAGVIVTFAVTAGDGTLSVTTATTDVDGLAATTLTLGTPARTQHRRGHRGRPGPRDLHRQRLGRGPHPGQAFRRWAGGRGRGRSGRALRRGGARPERQPPRGGPGHLRGHRRGGGPCLQPPPRPTPTAAPRPR